MTEKAPYNFDDADVTTIRNYERPAVSPRYQEELTQLGGLITHGPMAGEPALKLEWAPDFKRIRCGKLRPVLLSGHFLVHTSERRGVTDARTGLPRKVNRKKFLRTMRRSPERIGLVSKQTEYEWLSIQRWVILQHHPEALIPGTEFQWENLDRWDFWLNPDTGTQEWTDMIGPYPAGGRYEDFITVETEDGLYREMGDDIMELVRRKLQEREAFHDTLSLEERIRAETEAIEGRRRAAAAETAAQVKDVVDGPLARAILGLPFVSMTGTGNPQAQNARTRFGRASEQITVGRDGQKEVIKVNDKRRVK